MNIVIAIIITLIVYFGVIYLLSKVNEADFEDNKALDITINILISIFFIALILSPFIFMKFFGAELAIFGFGSIFAIIGGIAFTNLFKTNKEMNQVDKKENYIMTGIFTVIGLIIMILSEIVYINHDYLGDIFNTIIPLIGILIFPIVGVILLYLGIKNIIMPKEFSEKVQATCIDIKSDIISKNDRMQTVYSPVYLYNYKGEEYRECDNLYTSKSKVAEKGQKVFIKINPDKPQVFWDTKRRILKGKSLIIISIIFIIPGFIALNAFLQKGSL